MGTLESEGSSTFMSTRGGMGWDEKFSDLVSENLEALPDQDRGNKMSPPLTPDLVYLSVFPSPVPVVWRKVGVDLPTTTCQ